MGGNIRRRKDPSGFTLTELIITIAILGVLAAIAVPSFAVWLPNYRLRSAVQDIYSNMQFAKMTSIRSNIRHIITFYDTPAPGTYKILDDNGVLIKNVSLSYYDPGGHITYGKGNAAKPVPTGGSWPADFVSFTGNRATFNTRGLGKNGYVYIANNKGTAYAIGSLTSGVIRLRKWTGNSWE